MLRILYLEDHLLLREALSTLLGTCTEYQIVAQTSSPTEALNLLGTSKPDLALVDISLKERDGLWFVRELRRQGNSLPTLILTMHEDAHHVAEAFEAGANGYLVKSAPHEDFLTAVRLITRGQTYIHPSVSNDVVRNLQASRREEGLLSPREREILRLAAGGMGNQEIGEALYLSLSTIKTHLQSIYRKFNVGDRTQAILEGIRRKQLDLDDLESEPSESS